MQRCLSAFDPLSKFPSNQGLPHRFHVLFSYVLSRSVAVCKLQKPVDSRATFGVGCQGESRLLRLYVSFPFAGPTTCISCVVNSKLTTHIIFLSFTWRQPNWIAFETARMRRFHTRTQGSPNLSKHSETWEGDFQIQHRFLNDWKSLSVMLVSKKVTDPSSTGHLSPLVRQSFLRQWMSTHSTEIKKIKRRVTMRDNKRSDIVRDRLTFLTCTEIIHLIDNTVPWPIHVIVNIDAEVSTSCPYSFASVSITGNVNEVHFSSMRPSVICRFSVDVQLFNCIR